VLFVEDVLNLRVFQAFVTQPCMDLIHEYNVISTAKSDYLVLMKFAEEISAVKKKSIWNQ